MVMTAKTEVTHVNVLTVVTLVTVVKVVTLFAPITLFPLNKYKIRRKKIRHVNSQLPTFIFTILLYSTKLFSPTKYTITKKSPKIYFTKTLFPKNLKKNVHHKTLLKGLLNRSIKKIYFNHCSNGFGLNLQKFLK